MARQMRKASMSLRPIFLGVLSLVFLAALAIFAVFDVNIQRNQTESMLVEEARVFAREMDSVWKFMDNSQSLINTDADGSFNFKGLHCAIVGKSVGAIFSANSDYLIRYTNFSPRNPIDRPDGFEAEALSFFSEHGGGEYYGIEEAEGERNFRYLRALKIDEACIDCHGGPAGEIDATGYAKEGLELGDVGGAISITIPAQQHESIMHGNIARDLFFFVMLMVLVGLVVYLLIARLVLRPLDRMTVAFGEAGENHMRINVVPIGATREMLTVTNSFNGMAEELRGVYDGLEELVDKRTEELRDANEVLERQRVHLEKLNEQLSQETQIKSDLLSMVNHEFRTPLTSIITLAEVALETGTGMDEETYNSWIEVRKNSTILLGMVNNMLDIARSDAGVMKVACEPVDLGDVVGCVAGTIRPLARNADVRFTVEAEPDVPLVSGDYDKLLRILENLCTNALKFTPDGGTLTVSVAKEESGAVRISVKDDGIGIAEEDQERIFDRFVQVDSTTTRRFNGSGLGLALVKEYADAQGFAVEVKSKLHEGSVFSVIIPKERTMG